MTLFFEMYALDVSLEPSKKKRNYLAGYRRGMSQDRWREWAG
jgi:hypothetical protein